MTNMTIDQQGHWELGPPVSTLIECDKQDVGAYQGTIGICECFSNSIYVKYCLCAKNRNDDGV